jgi:hypothetical protein
VDPLGLKYSALMGNVGGSHSEGENLKGNTGGSHSGGKNLKQEETLKEANDTSGGSGSGKKGKSGDRVSVGEHKAKKNAAAAALDAKYAYQKATINDYGEKFDELVNADAWHMDTYITDEGNLSVSFEYDGTTHCFEVDPTNAQDVQDYEAWINEMSDQAERDYSIASAEQRSGEIGLATALIPGAAIGKIAAAGAKVIGKAGPAILKGITAAGKWFGGLFGRGGAGALSKAGQVMDRGGLTKAGRAMAKHGGRPGSVFTTPTGNASSINQQGQAALDDIVGNVTKKTQNRFGGTDYYGGSRGGGARFNGKGDFMGFLEP